MCLTPRPRRQQPLGGRCVVARATASSRIDPAPARRPQGYRLSVTPDRVEVLGHDRAGLFYGHQTWKQLVRASDRRWGGDGTVACQEINDWPDFPVRGVMLDVSRDRVPTLDTLRGLIDRLAHFKINQLQLYTEHAFAYEGHRPVWEHASPLTPDEIRELDRYCAERFVELVPNQNCFGHFERWLKHDDYRAFSEEPAFVPDDDVPVFYRDRVERGEMGHSPGRGSTLCPIEPRSHELVDDLLGQLRPCFSSGTINVGGDETFDLGFGRSRAACQQKGRGRVYLDYLSKLATLCEHHGWRMQFWGDLAVNHPELVAEVPRLMPGATALHWGYEPDQTFAPEAARWAHAGVPFYVCPSTMTFNALTGRVQTMKTNQLNAAVHGRAYGAAGYLNTWWGDWGHWQPQSVNDPGLVFGAALSWCTAANADLDLAQALSRHVYDDSTGNLAAGVLELGGVEEDLAGVGVANPLNWLLVLPHRPLAGAHLDRGWDQIGPLPLAALAAVEDRLERGVKRIQSAAPDRPDADVLLAELRNAAGLLAHAAQNARARILEDCPHSHGLAPATRRVLADQLAALNDEFKTIWLRQTREGGLADSVAPFEALLGQYPWGSPGGSS